MRVWSACSVAAKQNLSEVLRRKIMAEVAQEVVQNAGIDLDELRKKLVRAAAAEFTTYYYLT
jgi:hypothetical protein